MQVQLIPDESFTVRGAGGELTGMRAVSRWEGLTKLQDTLGRALIVADAEGPMATTLREVFGSVTGDVGRQCVVVLGTPDLVAALLPPPAPAAIHPDYLTIPETTLPNGTVVPSFRVGRYLASRDDDGRPVQSAELSPWVSISYHAARKACAEAGLKLLTETQALAIALDISRQDSNWTGGMVGIGSIYQGLHCGTVSSAQPANVEPPADERRWHVLSTGERIFDFAGNAYSWIFDDVQGNDDGLIAGAFAADSPSITTAPCPSCTHGVGWIPGAGTDWSGIALIRGGFWNSGSRAGVFRLGGDWPDRADGGVGFRCTL